MIYFFSCVLREQNEKKLSLRFNTLSRRVAFFFIERQKMARLKPPRQILTLCRVA